MNDRFRQAVLSYWKIYENETKKNMIETEFKFVQ
jgi:hypothetical protein